MASSRSSYWETSPVRVCISSGSGSPFSLRVIEAYSGAIRHHGDLSDCQLMGDRILHFFVASVGSGSKDAYSLLIGFDVSMKFVAPRGIPGNIACIRTLQMNQKFVVHGVGMKLRHSAQKIQVVVAEKDIFNALLKLIG